MGLRQRADGKACDGSWERLHLPPAGVPQTSLLWFCSLQPAAGALQGLQTSLSQTQQHAMLL